MTIDDAIRILDPEHDRGIFTSQEEYDQAKRLGIEALKAWKEHRGSGSLMSPLLLPGETKK